MGELFDHCRTCLDSAQRMKSIKHAISTNEIYQACHMPCLGFLRCHLLCTPPPPPPPWPACSPCASTLDPCARTLDLPSFSSSHCPPRCPLAHPTSLSTTITNQDENIITRWKRVRQTPKSIKSVFNLTMQPPKLGEKNPSRAVSCKQK